MLRSCPRSQCPLTCSEFGPSKMETLFSFRMVFLEVASAPPPVHLSHQCASHQKTWWIGNGSSHSPQEIN